MAPRNRRSARKPRRRYQRVYTETFTFSVGVGSAASVTVATLGNRPPRSNFKILKWAVTAKGFCPATNTMPGFYAPVGLQVTSMMDVEEQNTSGVRVAPCRFHMRAKQYKWLGFDTDDSYIVGNIAATCIGPAGGSANLYVRGVITLVIALSKEMVVAACPPSHISSSSSGSRPRICISSPGISDNFADVRSITEATPIVIPAITCIGCRCNSTYPGKTASFDDASSDSSVVLFVDDFEPHSGVDCFDQKDVISLADLFRLTNLDGFIR